MAGSLRIGEVVVVGKALVEGREVADEFTGRNYRVVELPSASEAGLADPRLEGADEDDASVWLARGRLTVVESAPAPSLEDVDAAYLSSRGVWLGADCAHYYRLGGEDVEEEGAPVECRGQLDCETCVNSYLDAVKAGELTRKAHDSAAEGDVGQAVRLAEEAVTLEAKWGEARTWRPFLDALRAYAAALEEAR